MAVKMGSKTVVVGAGITGATIAHLLQDAKRTAREVLVWEKNNIIGGRMMARSFRKDRAVHVDIGAQYLTKFSEVNDDIRQHLTAANKLQSFPNDRIQQDHSRPHSSHEFTEHLVGTDTKGFRSAIEYLLRGCSTELERELDHFEILNDREIKCVARDGNVAIANELILTCPIPMVLNVLEKSNLPQHSYGSLSNVEYSQRFALAYLFDRSIAPDVAALGWVARYVSKSEDQIIRYLCWDNLKKQSETDSREDTPFALVVHTSVPFGIEYVDQKAKDPEIIATVSSSLRKLLPFLPAEEDVLLHRWRFSQVSSEAAPSGQGAIVLHSHPRIIVAGDAFLGSTFDNCVTSAKKAVEFLGQSPPPQAGL